jgi:hypothetical protein
MPPGLAFEPANGRIFGTPTTQGAFAFTMVVRDSNSPQRQESRDYTITVGAPVGGALTITTTTLPTCKAGVPYMAEILVTGGLPPYTWSMDGNLVPGLSLNQAAGKIEGTPTTTGEYAFTARVFDSQFPSAVTSQTLTITCIDPLQITTESLPDGEVGVGYSQQLQAKGGAPCPGGPSDYVWSLESGFFPPGLTLNPNGSITGTPTSPGTYDFLARVTDCDTPPETTTKNLSITIKLVDGDRFLCVDGLNGNDATGDGTSANPFKTVTRALNVASANNLNLSLPRIGAIRIAGPSAGPPLEYHESVTLNPAAGTDVSLLGGWYGFVDDDCGFRLPAGTLNAEMNALGGPAITTVSLTRTVLIEQLGIAGDRATGFTSIAIENNDSSPTIARNNISAGNASDFSEGTGIRNLSGSSPLIVENTIYGGIAGGATMGILNNGLGTNPEVRANTIDGGDPSGGGSTTSVGIKNSGGADPFVYDNTITGGTGVNAYGIWNDPAGADIARNIIDCDGPQLGGEVCAGIYVSGAGSTATINANSINENSSTVGNKSRSSRGVWLDSSASASIAGNNNILGGEGFLTAYGILMENSSTATLGGADPGEPNTISGDGCFSLSTDDTWGIKVSSGSTATIEGNTVYGGCGINSTTGIGVDPATATITGNRVFAWFGGVLTTSIGIHSDNSTGSITSNAVSGGWGSLSIGILVENGTVANQPVIGSAGAGNTITGASGIANDAIGIWCINADPTIQNNDLISGSPVSSVDNQAIGIFLDDCDNVTVNNNTRIEGGVTDDTVGWSVAIRADFSTGVTISNNPMITGGGSLVSTGILLFDGSNATITGNTVNAGASTSINEGIVFSGSGGTVRNNTIDANGAGGLDAYSVVLFGCSNPSFGPAGGNTFQGASGNGRHLWNRNIPNPAGPPIPCGVTPLTTNAAGNTWSEAPAPAGLQCGPANDSLPPTRNYEIVNTGHCVQF